MKVMSAWQSSPVLRFVFDIKNQVVVGTSQERFSLCSMGMIRFERKYYAQEEYTSRLSSSLVRCSVPSVHVGLKITK